MNKMQSLSHKLKFIYQLIFYIIPIFNIAYWMLISEKTINQFSLSSMPYETVVLTTQNRLLGLVITAAPMLVLMVIFYKLVAIFKNYANEQVFCLENANHYKKIGGALLLLAITSFFSDSLLSVLLTQGSQQPIISIGFGSSQIYPILFGIMIYVVSFIMEEAHKMREDQKYTI